ncbi:hypothetical protein IPM62_03870 [Candidatus Woesebacteria bacterium]|nr:MAG: hypothetical protein IPM62_03870 [Candidatus Woesebacteria bacterium]
MENFQSPNSPSSTQAKDLTTTKIKVIKPVFSPPNKKLLALVLIIFFVLLIIAILVTRSVNTVVV